MNHATNEPTVFVVEDDRQVADSVCKLVDSLGLQAQWHASAEDFLRAYQPEQRGCLVTDIRLEGMDGVELQRSLNARGVVLPVIAITAHPETPVTVKVMQEGALTLLEKPYHDDELWNAILQALKLDAVRHSEQSHRQEIQDRCAALTDKEVDVLRQIIAGKSNKQIAAKLDVGLRTVEARRHEVFQKMQADSVAELVRLVIEAGIEM